MLKAFSKRRPKHLTAVYVEPGQVEILRAHRHWRSWRIQTPERFTVPQGEGIFDYLQRLNLRPPTKRLSALLLFLPLTHYSFHKEYYPANLQDHLKEVLEFDWQENLFFEPERSLHFFGPFLPGSYQSTVPIFSLQQGVHDKFQQALGGHAYQAFVPVPSSLAYATLSSKPSSGAPATPPHELLGRMIDPAHLEVHRFYEGALVDSLLVNGDKNGLTLFREALGCLTDEASSGEIPIQLLCSEGECHEGYARQWREAGLPIETRPLSTSVLTQWIQKFLQQDEVRSFESPLRLKPWKMPRVVFPLAAAVGLYAFFAFHQMDKTAALLERSQALKDRRTQLETRWKPIEQLQARIARLEEDHKSLAQFGQNSYPLLDLLDMLSERTPQDTWLNYFSLQDTKLTLRGESKSAIKYLTELSTVEGFEEVKFASPVSRLPKSDRERLVLNVRIDPPKLRGALEQSRSREGAESADGAATQAPDNKTVSKMKPADESPHGGKTSREADQA